MTNEMGNNNTSGLKEEENNAEEICKASWVISTLENGTTEEHQLVPELGEKDLHVKDSNLAFPNDPKRIGDPSVENQISIIEENQKDEAHPLDETPKMTTESTTADERDSNLQLESSLNDSVHEKPIEMNMGGNEVQETMQNQLEKHDSFKNDDKEDRTVATSDYLESKVSMQVEVCKASLLDSTREIDINEENQIGAEVQGNDLYEEVAPSITDDRKKIEDLCIENLISSTNDLEEDEEDEIISKSDDLEPKENVTAEAWENNLLYTTPENDTNEENEEENEVEEKGYLEEVAYSATDNRELIKDSFIENQSSRINDSEVPRLGDFPQHTLDSTKLSEEELEDSKVQLEILSSDAGDKESIEQTAKDYVIQDETV